MKILILLQLLTPLIVKSYEPEKLEKDFLFIEKNFMPSPKLKEFKKMKKTENTKAPSKSLESLYFDTVSTKAASPKSKKRSRRSR